MFNSSTDCLNAQEVYDFIENIGLELFHGESIAQSVDDGFAAVAGEIDFDAEAKAFFGDEDSRVVRAFFQNTKCSEIFEFMKCVAFGDTVFGEMVFDFAGRAKIRNKNSDDTEDN